MAATQKNRRTWETAFLLTASLDSGFKGAFEEAEQVMKDLRKEYDAESTTLAERTADAFDAAASAVVASGVIDLLGGIAQRYRDYIEAAADFEYTMSGVEAVALADAESMALLEEQAKELGATTKFTAVQSAEAMTYMAQAGWSTQEMLAGMPGVINLAAASGEDLAQSSSILADTLAGFQLQASESARVADVLAQAAAASNTSVIEMGDTFKTSAALAGALGYSIEDVSAAVGLMANVGIKGSRAGTTLRNILGGFLGGVTLKGTAIGEVEFSAVNADGSMQSFAETVEYLRGIFAQMTEAEKISNARNIAGERGYTGLIGILEATDEAYNEMYQSIQNAEGAAQRMAEIRLDNLTGDVTILKSAFEGLEITIGEQFNPGMREAVKLLTELTSGADQFIQTNPTIVKNIAALSSGVGSFAAVLATAVAASKILPGLTAALAAVGSNPIVLGIAGTAAVLGTLTTAMIAYTDASDQLVLENKELIQSHRELDAAHKAAMEQINAEEAQYIGMMGRLEELVDLEHKTAFEMSLINEIIDELNRAMPDLNLHYDAQANALTSAAESFDEYVEALRRVQEQEEMIQRAMELLGMSDEYKTQISETEKELAGKRAELEEIHDFEDDSNGLMWIFTGLSAAIKEIALQNDIELLEANISEMKDNLERVEAEYGEVKSKYEAAEPEALEAEQAESDAITIINFNSDSTMTAEDYIRALRNAGTEVTEAMIAAIEEQFGTGLRTGY